MKQPHRLRKPTVEDGRYYDSLREKLGNMLDAELNPRFGYVLVFIDSETNWVFTPESNINEPDVRIDLLQASIAQEEILAAKKN